MFTGRWGPFIKMVSKCTVSNGSETLPQCTTVWLFTMLPWVSCSITN
ncbi:MAG: hypothetical protein IPK99_04870 [Flavobacteriales bacterium]|nr:hypothetical protein [Flavobacteriales bacterium]